MTDLATRLRLVYLSEDNGPLCHEAFRRIKQLEAQLAKAVGALGDIGDGEPEWPNDPQKELDWCRNRARAVVALVLEEAAACAESPPSDPEGDP